MRFIIVFLLLLPACHSNGQSVPGMRLCADQYGNQYSCEGSSHGGHAGHYGNNPGGGGFSGAASATVEAAASVLVNVFAQWSDMGNIYTELQREELERQQRYAPRQMPQTPEKTPEEWEEIGKRAQDEAAENANRKLRKLAQEIEERFRESKEREDNRFREHMEDLAKYNARLKEEAPAVQEELARLTRERLEREERKKGNFPDSDIHRFRASLNDFLFHSADVKSAMLEIDIIRERGEDSPSPQGQQQIKELMAEFLNEDGLVKAWVSRFPDIDDLASVASADEKHRREIRNAINYAMMYHVVSEARGGKDREVITPILFDNIRRAKAVFDINPKFSGRYLYRTMQMVDWATEHPDVKRSAALSQMPKAIGDEFGLSDISADTFLGHEIINTAKYVARNSKVLDDDVNRFIIGSSFYQAKVLAAQNLIQETLAQLDRVVAVVDWAIGVTPLLGDFKDICEAVTGKKMCLPGGEALELEDRIFSAMGVVAGSGVMWKGASRLVKGAVAEVLALGEEQAFKLGRLKYTGEKEWTSTAGVVYESYGRGESNRIKHVLKHYREDPTKDFHTMFSIPKKDVLGLIDEAWLKKTQPLPRDPTAYVVSFDKVIGMKGERKLKIVMTKAGGNRIKTAYPVE